jgi:hypothetical protein
VTTRCGGPASPEPRNPLPASNQEYLSVDFRTFVPWLAPAELFLTFAFRGWDTPSRSVDMVPSHERICLRIRQQIGSGMMDSMAPKKTRVPRMLRGSLVTLRRRCGKPGCHCAEGQQRHEAPALREAPRIPTR